MRHSISGRKLSRTSSHRKALFMNLSNSLILNEQIKTTLPKAKDLRSVVEKIITLGKKETLHSKRRVFSILRNSLSVDKVFNILSKRYSKRNGGYTRVLKAGFRYGDSSPMAIIEFVERDVNAKGLIDKQRVKEELKQQDQNNQELKNQVPDKELDTKTKSDKIKEVKSKDNTVEKESKKSK
ncbi:MAG: 50S ribosomal protein L17 [Rickettsiales bacterium]|nr:50S ribosomal protein L17 [Rickettsiales bacterium]|tara:strand:+ start:46 stop:591 length:546 start_codon:yes stop_codon:yes gene_type:complete